MGKVSQLKKFIPLSLLIHAGAIFAAGLAAAPLVLKDKPSVEVEIGTGESDQAETLGIDVVATQGNFTADSGNEATPTNDDKLIDSPVIEQKTTPAAVVQKPTATPKIAAVKSSTPDPVVAPVQETKSETIQTEDLSLAATPAETPTEVAPEVATDITSVLPPVETKEIKPTSPTPAVIVKKETPVITEEEKQTEQTPTAAPVAVAATENNSINNESKASPSAKTTADSGSDDHQKTIADKNSIGEGAGTNGVNSPSLQLAGSAGGIKSLEQIRQKSGNPKPRYDRDERLRGDKGTVVFKAYINNAGSPVKIEKITCSGHPNLDQKSEKALLKWKFEAGQEGWVEVPFKWELKGDALESGGTLRRSAANPVEIP